MFGFHMPNFTFPGTQDEEIFDRVVELAQGAERVGFDLLTVMDHQYQIGGIGPEDDPMLEPYALLGALAAATSRVMLGTLVTGVTYRNPALLAKTVTTLDVISKGRAVFGLGAAWNEDEHRGLGIEFPPLRERFERLDEALTIARLMFGQVPDEAGQTDRPTFEGRHHRIERVLNRPRPIRPGGPPVLVGGGGEQKTLRLVARHADWANWFGAIPDLQRKHELLDRYCEEIGRDPASILRTVTVPLILVRSEAEGARALEEIAPARRPPLPPGTPEQLAERVREYLDAGFGGVVFRTARPTTPDWIQMAGQVIRLLR
jgi:F420-dependent oxidoreductase-like protein